MAVTRSWLMLVAMLVLVVVTVVQARQLQVSPTGSDSGDCGASACLTISYALSQAADGDQVMLAAGVYGGAGNVPFDITVPNVSIVGPSASNLATIDCAAGLPVCVGIEINGTITLRNLKFTGYMMNAPQFRAPRQDLIRIVRSSLATFHRSMVETVWFDSCLFVDNHIPSNITDPVLQHPFLLGSMVAVEELYPYMWVNITSTTFANSTVGAVRSRYSNLWLSEVTFFNVSGYGFASLAAIAVHPWIGGGHVYLSQINATKNGAPDSKHPLISYTGSRCWSSQCSQLIMNELNLSDNYGQYLIVVQDGASVAITRSVFRNNQANGILKGEIELASVLFIDSSEFSDNTLSEYAVAGRFTKSLISNTLFNNPKALTQVIPLAPGDLTIDHCNFTAVQSFSSISNNLIQDPLTLLITESSFYGGGTALSFSAGLVSGHASLIAVYNSTLYGPQYNPGVLLSGPIAFLMSGGGFVNNDNPSLEVACREMDKQQQPTLIEFLGSPTQLKSTASSISAGKPMCRVACIGDNTNACPVAPAQQPSKGVSQGTFWTVTVLLVVYSLLASLVAAALFYRLKQNGGGYSLLN